MDENRKLSGGSTKLTSEQVSCTYQAPVCRSFTYSSWSVCKEGGSQDRSVLTQSPTNCQGGNPDLIQSCSYLAPSCTYSYSEWSVCIFNLQYRGIISSSPSNCKGNPLLIQSCQFSSNSSNFILNSPGNSSNSANKSISV